MIPDGRDLETRVRTERSRLVGILEELDERQWRSSSCAPAGRCESSWCTC